MAQPVIYYDIIIGRYVGYAPGKTLFKNHTIMSVLAGDITFQRPFYRYTLSRRRHIVMLELLTLK